MDIINPVSRLMFHSKTSLVQEILLRNELKNNYLNFFQGFIHLVCTQRFPKNQHFLSPDAHTYVSESGGKKCQFFGKLCLLTKCMIPSPSRKTCATLNFYSKNASSKSATLREKQRLLHGRFCVNVPVCQSSFFFCNLRAPVSE